MHFFNVRCYSGAGLQGGGGGSFSIPILLLLVKQNDTYRSYMFVTYIISCVCLVQVQEWNWRSSEMNKRQNSKPICLFLGLGGIWEMLPWLFWVFFFQVFCCVLYIHFGLTISKKQITIVCVLVIKSSHCQILVTLLP